MPQEPETNEEIAELDSVIDLQKKLRKAMLNERKPVETLFSWTAPERDYDPKSRKWFIGVGFLALVLIVFSALTNNFGLIFAIIAVVLVIYTVNTIPPRDITHQITNKGLYSFETIFLWKNMLAFWITVRNKKCLVHIQYKGKSNDLTYQEMIILVGKKDVEQIVTMMVPYVDYLGPSEVNRSFLTSLAQGRYLPLLEILKDENIPTKDPKDAPSMLRGQRF